MQLSLIIPAYNEEKRIKKTLVDYATYFNRSYGANYEILVILNGCLDDTLAVVKEIAKDFDSIKYANYPHAIGKGGAIIEGFKLAQGELVGYVDADGATPPRAFNDLVENIDRYDCIFGSRWLPGAKVLKQPLKRRVASRVFNFLVNTCFPLHCKDTQCGAKLIRKRALNSIHDYLTITDMAFDVNLLYALKMKGYTMKELPTEWSDKLGSKVKILKTSLRMFLSIMRLRLIYSPFALPLTRVFRPLVKYVYKRWWLK